MSYNYPKLYAAIIHAANIPGSFTERMHHVIQECEAQCPHADWMEFRAIDFQADKQSLSQWLHRAFGPDWLDHGSQGLWVGLVQVEHRGKVTADAYAAASPSFESHSLEWAYEAQRFGDSSYLGSEVLESIYSVAYARDSGLGNSAEYPLVLAYGAMCARAALENTKLPAQFKKLLGAAVGYDDGDFLFLGEFTNGKFIANIREG
jgi:hypothetical protein